MLRFLRRRRLPRELRDALRVVGDRAHPRTPRLPRVIGRLRRVPIVVWLMLLAIPVVGATWDVLQRQRSASFPTPPPERLSGLARVIDGDTLALGSERLRIHGIDAPEIGQVCEVQGRAYRCGESARDALVRILGRGMVSCDALDRDIYGRRIVACHGEDGRDIGAAMVSAGWAVAFTRYSYRYVPQELAARAHGRGLWAGEFETPSDHRRRGR